jgi:hypothetical protein
MAETLLRGGLKTRYAGNLALLAGDNWVWETDDGFHEELARQASVILGVVQRRSKRDFPGKIHGVYPEDILWSLKIHWTKQLSEKAECAHKKGKLVKILPE